ncbi:MAG: MBOAT family protein [Spirochaetales bacterium]|nr:MBOAT family protein [Spirochaetales bacterium]
MVFSSHLFLFFFLPLVLVMYYLSPKKTRHLGLTILSYIFYGWANPVFVVLMFTSTCIDYFCGLAIDAQEQKIAAGSLRAGKRQRISRQALKKLALIVSICTNLSLLGFFKYFNLFVDSINALAALSRSGQNLISLSFRIALPLGISFYTFQSMSYTIDLYRGKVSIMKNFIDFACYVSLFPQLVAGPIIRFSEVADQFANRTHSAEKFARGFSFLALGLAKKVLLANACGKIADLAFGTGNIPAYTAWYGIIAYAFQIYYDFSGYSDMAIGLGLMLGFVFPKNFDSPYHSKSITEFWRRWHLSLSYWLRDYLYIPLGGNKKGNVRTYVNLMVVMLLGGLWHGASWNFVIWGGFHGILLVGERLRGKRSVYKKLPDALRIFITFVLVLFTWVFFRAETLPGAIRYLGSMFGLGHVSESALLINRTIFNPYYVMTFIVTIVITWFGRQTWDWTRTITAKKAVMIAALFIVSVLILTTQDFNPFIYFIF